MGPIQSQNPTPLRVNAFIDGNGGLTAVAKNRVHDLEQLHQQHGEEFQAGATVFIDSPNRDQLTALAKSGAINVAKGALAAAGLVGATGLVGLAVALALPVGLAATVGGAVAACSSPTQTIAMS